MVATHLLTLPSMVGSFRHGEGKPRESSDIPSNVFFFFRCFSTADLANLLVCRSFSRHGGNSLLALLLVLAPGLPFDLLRPGGIIAGGYVRPLKSLDHPRPEQRDGRFSGKSRI
jgi:hypothetical protein